MNQCNSKDLSSEKEDIIRFVATEATPAALTTREITLRTVTGPNVS